MTSVTCLTLNPLQENTYIVANSDGDAILFDPGCYDKVEEDQLFDLVRAQDLSIVEVINTHCHLDHVFGNRAVVEHFSCPLRIHRDELEMLNACPVVAQSYGMQCAPSPAPSGFLAEGDVVDLGDARFTVLFTPGHSPASICLYNEKENYVIAGDVLFRDSIGRYDLPGGNQDVLYKSIRTQLYVLPDETIIYPGHGPQTTIGYEKKNNPFVRPL